MHFADALFLRHLGFPWKLKVTRRGKHRGKDQQGNSQLQGIHLFRVIPAAVYLFGAGCRNVAGHFLYAQQVHRRVGGRLDMRGRRGSLRPAWFLPLSRVTAGARAAGVVPFADRLPAPVAL